MRCFLFNLLWWGERMRQSARHIYVPHGNEVYVNNWRAWRIQEYTIKKILKNRCSQDFFDFIYCISRHHAPTTLRHFAKPSGGQARKFKPTVKGGFYFDFRYFHEFELIIFEKRCFYPIFELFYLFVLFFSALCFCTIVPIQ